ncbi:hypothetical protein SLEP1_g27993 [Rubroshorea leprosula]|uniref:Uncharacterized protein n=1 Tax=Rubroshorea leprosula TaxID=152421 RepID=A0AAV5K1V6_9ROSI|nr:hypothetical protein SLEP1_g27993 [Rubroshorea leprosula]
MSCLARVLAVQFPPQSPRLRNSYSSSPRFLLSSTNLSSRWRSMAANADSSSFSTSTDSDSADKSAAGFCIIEGPETVQDFAKMEMQEIQDNIRSRRNKIFLHMEEVSN